MKKIVYVSCCLNGYLGLRKILLRRDLEILLVYLPASLPETNSISGYFDFESIKSRASNVRFHALKSYGFDEVDTKVLKDFGADVFLVNGWNRLIPASVFSLAKTSVGVHAGHPPRGRGRAPVPWTLIKGFRDLEVYLFRLTDGADNGPILDSQRIEIHDWEDAATLYDKVAIAIAHMYDRSLDHIMGGQREGVLQLSEGSEFYPKRTPEDGLISWSANERTIYNLIRALSKPYPGAFSFLKGEKFFIYSGAPFDRCLNFGLQRLPGTILDVLPSGLVVQTGGSTLLVRTAEWKGQKLSEGDWLSYESFVGECFTSQSES